MKNDAQTVRRLFGEMAVEKGYCTQRDVSKALKIQQKLAQASSPKMLGLIMLEEAMIDNSQFITLLQELDKAVHEQQPE